MPRLRHTQHPRGLCSAGSLTRTDVIGRGVPDRCVWDRPRIVHTAEATDHCRQQRGSNQAGRAHTSQHEANGLVLLHRPVMLGLVVGVVA
jgi:hypothetical protein